MSSHVFPEERPQRAADGSLGCGRGHHLWFPSVDLPRIEERFFRQVTAGVPVAGLTFQCVICKLSVPTVPPEERPRPDDNNTTYLIRQLKRRAGRT